LDGLISARTGGGVTGDCVPGFCIARWNIMEGIPAPTAKMPP